MSDIDKFLRDLRKATSASEQLLEQLNRMDPARQAREALARIQAPLMNEHALDQARAAQEAALRIARATAAEQTLVHMNTEAGIREAMMRVTSSALDHALSQITRPLALPNLVDRAWLETAIEATRPVTDRLRDVLTPPHARLAEDALLPFSIPAYQASALAFIAPSSVAGLLGADSALKAALCSLRTAVEDPSQLRLADLLEFIERGVEEALEAEPEGRMRLLSRRHLVAIIFFILSAAQSHLYFHLSAEAQKQFESRVMQQIDRMHEISDDDAQGTEGLAYGYYLVDRQAPLRQAPRQKGTVLAWLQPNELLSVIGRRGRWLRVAFVDPIDGRIHEGWVLKKYLRR